MAARDDSRPGSAIRRLLQALLEAARGERAFLVRPTPSGGAVVAAVIRRRDGETRPSRTALRLAGEYAASRLWDAGDAALAGATSVRRLALSAVVTMPVPGPPPGALLLIDSRSPTFARRVPLRGCEAFAALAGLLLLAGRPSPPPPSAGRERVGLVGSDPVFVATLEEVDRAAATRLPVLVRGETGTGKEGICRRIHQRSTRRDRPFLAVNCSAFPEGLLESELFGAERGSYTGADRDRPGLFRQADGGTLLLDEIGDMPASMQAKLLRALQEGAVRPVGSTHEVPVDVRIVAATHRDLPALARAGAFRPDLLHRLAVLEIRVPPLRERLGDLPALVRALAAGLEDATGLGPLVVERSGLAALAAHDWPGNVRELEGALARGLVRSGGSPIAARHLELCGAAVADDDDLERSMIRAALVGSRGNLALASKRIGWSRQKLYRRLSALGMDRPPHSEGGETTPSSSSTFQ